MRTVVQPAHTPTPPKVQSPSSSPVTTSSVCAVVPTPEAHTCPTPGTYTFPASTITLTETTTVCAATTTTVPSGTHTVGGVTTIVETATTVTCPIAHVETVNGEVTSTILHTTYVCPSAGTYTIAPTTTTVTESCTITYPVPATYTPGTYTKPQQVVTVTVKDYITWCPFANAAPSTSASVSATAVAAATTVVPTPATTSAMASAQTVSASPASSGSKFQSNNDNYGITYTPYTSEGGQCKSQTEITADIAGIQKAGFTTVRVYSTDCNTLQYVGSACEEYGLKMIIGVFIKDTGCTYSTPDIKQQVDDIAQWAQWDLVNLFVVGNEAILDGYCTASELRSLLLEVKSMCSGYTGAYTIAETLNIWQESEVASAMCDIVDITGANLHAFFNSDTTAAMAGNFVKSELDILDNICEGKTGINLECGWPTAGDCNGVACPGMAEQALALKTIQDECGDRTVFFSHSNDLWKSPGAFNCEQSWGIGHYFTELLETLL